MSFEPVITFGTTAAVALIGWGVSHALDTHPFDLPHQTAVSELVVLGSGSFEHPQAGEFLKGNHPVAAPIVQQTMKAPLEIMKYQVSISEYGRCVAEGACKPADSRKSGSNIPVTGVSHIDAEVYATWLSARTGQAWRLPTDVEWAYAASEKFRGDIEGEGDPNNPARRWLTRYRLETALGRKPDPEPRAQGSFGTNSKGVADIAGNVWEWTSTCYSHAIIAIDGKRIESSIDNCGVHVVEGFHRTYMSNFIRDGKSGGCAVGTPPDNLGFRLVRDRPSPVQAALRRLGFS
ncbi:formylglycine-generating enzyme family protein [Mesorhizobium sp. M0119]|uniref:SUMF1/EgtB/PvdO family nonheme iron enzyme n=1 Tax=Mesorhizobium sp. M0119 TaxID=2956885 RepID=UPI0033374217